MLGCFPLKKQICSNDRAVVNSSFLSILHLLLLYNYFCAKAQVHLTNLKQSVITEISAG